MAKKKNTLSRSDAAELYRDLQKTMKNMKGRGGAASDSGSSSSAAKEIAAAIKASMAREKSASPMPEDMDIPPAPSVEAMRILGRSRQSGSAGQVTAVALVVLFALTRFTITALEQSGIVDVPEAKASMAQMQTRVPFSAPGQYTKEEVEILRSLDVRRQELEERERKIVDQESEMAKRDKAYAARLTEIRELTQKLESSREKNEKKRNTQLEQLSNVYGSMNPKEAAELMEQLDVSIALALLERMPEKRIGQILSLMSPDRALTMTRMLSTAQR